MKNCLLLALLLISLHVYPQAPANYYLAWADEFNSATLDTVNWRYRIDGSGNSYQRPENVVLENGKVRINLKKENYKNKSYTGGGIITKIPRRFGYYEVSVKLSGKYGWHEAFWTTFINSFTNPNPGYQQLPGRLEIDCFEHYSEYNAHYFSYGAIGWAPVQGNINRDFQTTVPDLTTTYNTFGFEYTPDYLNYFFNGVLLKTVDMREQIPHDFYLWLTTIAKKPDAADSAGAVFFDYLRCYEISSTGYNARKVPFIRYLDSLRGATHSTGRDLWIEAEDFKQPGNWTREWESSTKVIKGFTSKVPGRDSTALKAVTHIIVDSAATYSLWVRARDFTTAPGTRNFKVLINGIPASRLFGNHGGNGYAWENGGQFYLPAGSNKIELFDLSQYYARCDRLLLTTDSSFVPQGLGGARNVVHEESLPSAGNTGKHSSLTLHKSRAGIGQRK